MARIFWQFVAILLLIGFVGAYFWWIVAALQAEHRSALAAVSPQPTGTR
jgi:hypothetical protein